jgi:hypothetical protein
LGQLTFYNGWVCPKALQGVGRQWVAATVCAATLTLTLVGCGENTGSPTPPTPPTPPPVVVNTPPVIQSIAVSSPRVDATDEIQVTSVVQDAETPLEQLTYTWSASPAIGTFTGTGAQVRWRPPTAGSPEASAMPVLYTLTLTVTERYTSAGEQKQNSASSTAQVHYNNSVAEISKLSMDFLTDFTTYSVTPEQCVRNFSDSCRGKRAELTDVQQNRELFQILGGQFSVSSVTLNSDKTSANVVAPCTFFDIVKATGVHETVSGTCLLTAVYENWRWFLCDSNFSWSGTTTSALRERLRFSHP